jgi:hypothetical protein
MKLKNLIPIALVTIALLTIMPPTVKADSLTQEDFLRESFSKTVDFLDYARNYAANHSMTPPPDAYHAYLYMNYINTSGLKLFYAGLDNITFGNAATFRIPMQAFIMHYKTNNNSRDVVLASTFLMLLAFNETTSTLYPDSPDMNDTLYASFSLGFDLSAYNLQLPVFNSKTEQIPLTHSDDKLNWHWGMKYTNLTAIWWRTWFDPSNSHFDSSAPLALTTYDELTFTYDLTIDPTTHTASLTENHIIGKIRDLVTFWIDLTWPIFHHYHYNSTGTYQWGNKTSDETVYDFMQRNHFKMSIVNFQTSILADRETYSQTPQGQNVTDSEIAIGNTSVGTYTDDGEKICEANFGTKKNYQLYNYTAYPAENVSDTYEATTRTAKTAGYAGNANLFIYHIGLMKFLPLVVAHMYPGIYARAMTTICNMSRANYFYIIGYPTYSGYRVEQDPTLTVYLTTTPTSGGETTPPNWGGILAIAAIATVIVLAVVLVLTRRKPKQSLQPPAPPTIEPPAS